MPRGPGTYGSKVGRPPKKIEEYGHGGGITVVLGGKPKPSYARGGKVGPTEEQYEEMEAIGLSRSQVDAMGNEGRRPSGAQLRKFIEAERRRGMEAAPVMPTQKPEGNSKGGKVSAYKKGGKVRVRKSKKRSFKGDGIARQGKTRGKIY